MTQRFLEFIPFIFEWEGGYDNDPDDPGGETKYGIDRRSHPGEDIRSLTMDRAREIYLSSYWQPMRCEELPPKVGEALMNFGVNCGIGRAVKWLQGILGVAVDGIPGPKTLAAAQHADAELLAGALASRAEEHYRDIARGSLAKFLRGWLNRTEALRRRLGL